jgi:hypothetical protein
MAAAYAYAEGSGQAPREIILLNLVDRFGAQGVLGRALGAGEIRRMLTAEAVVRAYQERERSGNWAAWVREHPEKDRLLREAMLHGTE